MMKKNKDRAVAILESSGHTQVLHLGLNGSNSGNYKTVARCASVYLWLYRQPWGLSYSSTDLFSIQDEIWFGTMFGDEPPITSHQTMGSYLSILAQADLIVSDRGKYGGYFIPENDGVEPVPEEEWEEWGIP